MLIKNLNKIKTRNVIGKMVYNPELQRWDGNWEALRQFEERSSKPALISQLSYRASRVGDMIFDKERMVWLKSNGNDEDDPFEGIDDLKENEGEQTPFSKGKEEEKRKEEEKAELTFNYYADEPQTPQIPFDEVEFRKQIEGAAAAHNQFISNWTKANGEHFVDDEDREFLYLIRAIAGNR